MSDLIKQTAAQMAAALADGTTTSVELTQAHLDRIAAGVAWVESCFTEHNSTRWTHNMRRIPLLGSTSLEFF